MERMVSFGCIHASMDFQMVQTVYLLEIDIQTTISIGLM